MTGKGETVDLTGIAISNNGIELQDREFVAALREGPKPDGSMRKVMPCYRMLNALESQLG